MTAQEFFKAHINNAIRACIPYTSYNEDEIIKTLQEVEVFRISQDEIDYMIRDYDGSAPGSYLEGVQVGDVVYNDGEVYVGPELVQEWIKTSETIDEFLKCQYVLHLIKTFENEQA